MLIKRFASLLTIAGLAGGIAVAAETREGAMLQFKISSESVPESGIVKRGSLESSVLVAFNEKFAMEADQFKVELTATNGQSSTSVNVVLFDARSNPAVLVGAERMTLPVAGSNTIHMTGADGTTYAVSVQVTPAQLPR